jgi:hypothetical protein
MDEILHTLRHRKTSLFKLFFCVVLLTFNVVKSEANPLVTEPKVKLPTIGLSSVEKKEASLLPISLLATTVPNVCGAFVLLELVGRDPAQTYTYEVKHNGAPFTLSKPLDGTQDFDTFEVKEGGVYEITVTDANDNTITATASVTVKLLSLTLVEKNDIKCIDEARPRFERNLFEGSIVVMPMAGDISTSGVYSYILKRLDNTSVTSSFTSGDPTFTIDNLSAGVYSIMVMDDIGCEFTLPNFTITKPTSFVIATTAISSPIACFGGKAILKTTTNGGGKLPISFSIDGGTPQTISTLPAEFVFTGVIAGTHKIQVTDDNGCLASLNTLELTEPSSIEAIANQTCSSPTSTDIVVTARGGTAPYSYSLDDATYQLSNTFLNVAPDLYTIFVKDANGCTLSDPITIGPTTLSYNVLNPCVPPSVLSPTLLDLRVTNGTGSYTFSFLKNGIPDGANLVNVSLPQTYSVTEYGTYTISVTDANGCMSSTIFVHKPLTISLVNKRDILCVEGMEQRQRLSNNPFKGGIEVMVMGGSSKYSIAVLNPDGSVFNTYTTPILEGLSVGTYTVVVTDVETGCQATLINPLTGLPTITITGPPEGTAALMSGELQTKFILCNSLSTGELTITPTGGVGNKTVTFNGVIATASPSLVYSGLAAGSYPFVVMDEFGCKVNKTIDISEPPPLSITSIVPTNILCNGSATGQLDVTATGGTGVIEYSKDGITYQLSNIFTGLVKGTYTITVRDVNSCTDVMNQTITEPSAPLSITATPTEISCFGGTGSVELRTSGGTAPYTYTGDATTALEAGTYKYFVTDANRCIDRAIVTINPAPTQLVLTATPTQITCFGGKGSVALSATGGTAPYIFSGAATTDLVAGTYTYSVVDSKGCTATDVTVTISAAPAQLILTATPTQITCFGGKGSVALSATGGTAPYIFSGAATTDLVAGTYTYSVVDSKGCTATDVTVTISAAPAQLILTATPTQIKCFGGKGSVALSATGGTAPYTFSGAAATDLVAGTYTYNVTDSKGCIATASVEITQPLKDLSLTLVSQTNIKCKSDVTGTIEVMPMGGTAPYSYIVNGTAFESTPFNDLPAKLYVINVIDNNGCTLVTPLNVTLTEPIGPLSILSNPTVDVLCKGDAKGSIIIKAKGGTVAYTYSIDNGVTFQPSNVFNNLLAKTYKVVVKDANGCMTPAQDVEIKEPDLKLDLAIINKIDIGCNIRTGSATLVATGGMGEYTYKLGSVTQTTTTFTNLAAGDYIVSVTDANNCLATRPLSILDNKTNPNAPNALQNITLCKSEQVILTPTGSTGTYNFYDKNPVTNIGLTPLATNIPTYTFTPTINTTIWITAVTGVCESTPIEFIVTILEPLKLTAIPTKPLCPNGVDGKINLTITGGITPYIINWTGSNRFVSINEDLTGLKAGIYTVEVGLNEFTCKEALQVVVPEGMDMTPPTIKTKDLTVYLDAQGKATISVSQLDNGTTDNCSLQSIAIDKSTFMCGQVGANTVIFTAADASGNTSTSNATVTVIDNIKPVIACPATIEVTLNALECSRKIDFAAAIATDNCSAVVTQMSGLASGSLFEAGNYKVTYRATDPSGNTADCVVDIKVNEYKAGGGMLCVGSLNLSLGELCVEKVTPKMILLGNDYRCLNSYDIMLKDKNGRLVEDDFIRATHIGTRMTISVVDPKTGSSCWGYVNIDDKMAPIIECPFNTLVLCDDVEFGSAPPSSKSGEPRIISDCSRTNTSYSDQFIEINCSETFLTKPADFPTDLTFNVDMGAQSSKIIIRTFTVSDIYGNFTKCKQAIYVKTATLDRVSCPSSAIVRCVNGFQNLNPRDTTINGFTYTGTGEPKYSNGNPLNIGSCKIQAGYSDQRFTYVGSGRTEIERTWILLNCCTGEKTQCIQILSLNDAKPTLTLKAGQKFDLTVSKTVQVTDNQLINLVSDDCTSKSDLQLGMREKGTGTGFPTVRSLTFGCANLGKRTIEIWVKDGLGNTETQTVDIEITDSKNYCNPTPTPVSLKGSVTRESGDKITSLVTLYRNNDSITTQSTADFSFTNLVAGASYRLKPVRDNDIFNGVTTFDISVLSRYLLGIDSTNITTPARMIAADVNNDGEIDGADMIHIRNLILRKTSSFPNNKAWRFVSKNYVFLNPEDPFSEDFPEALNYNNLNRSITDANFTAIKVGDVNGTARNNFSGSNTTVLNVRGTKPILNVETEDIELKKGETKMLSFRLNDPSVSGLTAVQFALNFDKNKANITHLKQGEITNWTEANQNLIASEGILTTAWSTAKATRFDKNQTAFTLSITAKEDLKLSEIARQNATFTEGIAYDAAGNELSIQLVFNSLGIKENNYKYSLLQNVPNPFTQETVIPFTMSKEDLATLTVFDATGKIVSTTQRTFAKGYNEVVFKTPNLSNAGVYYYRLQTGEFSAVMRMILVK